VADKLRVYFTIDTETSLGGAWHNGAGPMPLAQPVWGEFGGKKYGITLIMDILEEHGFRGTFFVEVFCSYWLGTDELARVFRCIQSRGHDAQLHLHPVQRFYYDFSQGGPRREQDLLFQFPAEEQRRLIEEGVRLFRKLSGRQPRAYRAGCYAASEVTLQALRQNGIAIDSSYNLSALDKTCGFRYRPLNAPRVIEGVSEFPVTNFLSGPWDAYKPLEISAVSVPEILATMAAMREAGCRDAVLVFHSFSFLKNRGVRYEAARPDLIVLRRFRKLCRELSRRGAEFEVAVLSETHLEGIEKPQPQVIPSIGWLQPTIRKAVQAWDRIPWV
jgi:peptidoglycan/xylan/chitin deacetylase (PgdA/CDA1 family)